MKRRIAGGALFLFLLAAVLPYSLTLFRKPAAAAAEDAPRVAITFDDGPCYETTERLLDGLKERQVRATFFLIGEQIAGQENTVRRMKREGHQVGNHTYSHTRLDRSADGGQAELNSTDALLCELLGKDEYWLRPPWGFVGDRTKKTVCVPMVYWSVDTADWQVRNSDIIARCIIDNAQDGDIILLHDIFPESVKAALSAIDTLSAQGYQFVTVEELFKHKGVTPQLGMLYARADTLVTW